KIAFLVSDRKSTELLENGELDIITPDDYTTESQDLISFAKNKGYKLHKTFNIKSNILVFTDKSNSFLSSERKRKIGKIIRNAFEQNIKDNPAVETAYQFFPDLSEVGLKKEKLDQIIDSYEKINIENEEGDG